MQIVTKMPLRFDIKNRRTWYHLKEVFNIAEFQDFYNAMSVVDVQKMNDDIFVLPGQEVINEWAVGFQPQLKI